MYAHYCSDIEKIWYLRGYDQKKNRPIPISSMIQDNDEGESMEILEYLLHIHNKRP